MSESKAQLKSKNYSDLVLNGTNDEYMLKLLAYQLNKAEIQGKHILKALQLVDCTFKEKKNITWYIACEQASDELIIDYCRQSITRWFILYRDNNYKIKVSKQGKYVITKDFNPFVTVNANRTKLKKMRIYIDP